MKRKIENWMQLTRRLNIGINDMQVLQVIAQHRENFGKTDDQLKLISNMCPGAREVAYEIKYENSVNNQDAKDLAAYLKNWAEARRREANKNRNRNYCTAR